MIGRTLGQYTVESQLGAGGMGVVYLATDTRLGRHVAIKMLHDISLADPERLARFDREARLLAALNHQNIAAIHGVEKTGDTTFLVLEYVPGETLADRIGRGPLPLADALEIACDIAEALDAAHQRGIIHRDLKPANVKITPGGQVKVLDFGLAKSLEAGAVHAFDPADATQTAGLTHADIIVGTVAYMSPEQASGRSVDGRADIWALGCVLYEMLTGQRPFRAGSTSELLVQVLERDPDWTALPDDTPASVRRLLRRCLKKDPRRRLHHAGDARLELEEVAAGDADVSASSSRSITRRRRVETVIFGVIAGLIVGVVGAGVWMNVRRGSDSPLRVVHFSIDLPLRSPVRPGWGVDLVFSRDSRTLVYPVGAELYERRLDAPDALRLAAAAGLRNPIYSPDSQSLLMPDYVKGMLVKVPLGGGARVPVAPVDMFFRGEWSTDGYIYVTNQLIGGVVRVPEDGGPVEPVTEIDAAKHERSHRFAAMLPGGRAMLLTVASGDIATYDEARIDVADLVTKKRKTVITGGTYARYSPSGHIVYARAGSLFAVPFDERALTTSGAPVKVLDGVLMSTNIGTAYYDISPNGDLAYAVGPAESGGRTLHWVDRQGRSTALPLPARPYLNPRLSPDGRRLAIEIEGANHDFYVYDFDRGILSKFTTDGTSHAPIWSPDGRQIAYRTWKGGAMTMARMPADRSAPEQRLVNFKAWQSAVSFSPDAKYLAFDQYDRTSNDGGDIWVMPLEGGLEPQAVVKTPFPEGGAKFSPDGRWLLYSSMESGRSEVYVQAWPGPGAKVQISSEGGTDAMWRRDGAEIFYRADSAMVAVPVSIGGRTLHAGKPHRLWTGEYFQGLSSSCGWRGTSRTSYDISPDGERFLMIKDADMQLYATKINVIVNWVEELKRTMVDAVVSRSPTLR